MKPSRNKLNQTQRIMHTPTQLAIPIRSQMVTGVLLLVGGGGGGGDGCAIGVH